MTVGVTFDVVNFVVVCGLLCGSFCFRTFELLYSPTCYFVCLATCGI